MNAPRDVATLTADNAKRLTSKIRLRLDNIADNLEAVGPLIAEAKAGGAHVALRYKSWTKYVADEFGGHLTRLAKLDRGPVVELLSAEGMSARSIGQAIGVSHTTVNRDQQQVEHDVPPAAEGKTPVAGKSWAVTGIREGWQQQLRLREKEATSSSNVVGIDGKSYPRPEPAAAKPRRRPLPEAYRDHGRTVLKNVESLSRLHQDDRFTANREAVLRDASQLARAANGLLDLLEELGVDRHKYSGGGR